MPNALMKLTALTPGTAPYAQTLRNALDEMNLGDPEYHAHMNDWSRLRAEHLAALPDDVELRADHTLVLTPRLLTPLHVLRRDIEFVSLLVGAAVAALLSTALGWTFNHALLGLCAGAASTWGVQVFRDHDRYRRLTRIKLPLSADEEWLEVT